MKKYIPFFLFLFLFLGVNLFKVFSDIRPFYDWDESIYAQVGKEMIREKSYIVPLWQGKAWLDKPPIPPLMYGMMTYIPVKPEISMRVLTVLLSGFALGLLYVFSIRYSKSIFVSLLTVVITSFIPAYLQRTQSLNVDVFLLIGWLGYVLWYRNLWMGAFFLLFGVLSKSLLGFYPVVMVTLFELVEWKFHGKKDKNRFRVFMQNTLIQVGISSLWFFWMYYAFRDDFIQYHFVDSHLKRVTSSIEQHFGQRTFYIDLLLEQMKWGIYPAIVSLVFLGISFMMTRSEDGFFPLIFIPWFLFLNLTKTKIEWYLYPVIPQFVFLAVYMVRMAKSYWIQGMITLLIFWYFFAHMVPLTSYMTSKFSQWDDHQLIAVDAHRVGCRSLVVLVNDSTRTSYATLKSMDLVIHTTTWWGNHPSMAYYSEVNTSYKYTTKDFEEAITAGESNSCFTAERPDWNEGLNLRQLSDNKTFVLGVKD